ncbi:hypothetical protein AVV30_gp108 [Vibrio phage phi 1]|uniref:Uncharacterized protein n=1 Tax=Vibrio phage phi 1 TaxID=1589297 RepID=A0A0B5GYJ5_9CAUD|nr:hypothetical protein AVV30_gp108 [Vibrio phage phi 1]AJF40766.1 hypothetical protein SBVP1_0108 [Vibrio phage phi 1]
MQLIHNYTNSRKKVMWFNYLDIVYAYNSYQIVQPNVTTTLLNSWLNSDRFNKLKNIVDSLA